MSPQQRDDLIVKHFGHLPVTEYLGIRSFADAVMAQASPAPVPDEQALRDSVPDRWKACTSAVGGAQAYIAELEEALHQLGVDVVASLDDASVLVAAEKREPLPDAELDAKVSEWAAEGKSDPSFWNAEVHFVSEFACAMYCTGFRAAEEHHGITGDAE